MKKSLTAGLKRLVGTLNIGKLDADRFAGECAAMKELGYYGVYFNDIFFTFENLDCSCPEEDILFREDKCLIVRRSQDELRKIKNILAEYDLQVPSAHFPSVLPQPGAALESIFETHKKILDMAQLMELRRVTTHIGHIVVPLGSLLPEKLISGELSYMEYCEQLKAVYGEEKIIPDSITVYQALCKEAARRGITVTIETACCELFEVNTKPEAMLAFIKQVGADNLKVCIDAGHCHVFGLDIAKLIRKYGAYFVETHFHDNFRQKDEHNPVGIGTINRLDIIRAMNENNYQGEITFEQSDYSTNCRNWNLFLKLAEKELTEQE
jgi:sugar phosphate isomerase/epimerase